MTLYDLVALSQQMGLYDILLPFLLVFTLSFAVLQKIKLFGSNSKNINLIIGLVIGFFFLNNPYLIFILQQFLPGVSIFLVIFLAFLLLFGIFSGPRKFKESSLGLAFFVSLGAVLIALFTDVFSFGPNQSTSPGLLELYYAIDPGTRFMIWLLVLGALFVWYVTSGETTSGGGVKGFLGDLFKSMEEEGSKGR